MAAMRRLRNGFREVPFSVVLVVVVGALLYILIAPQHWLRGVTVLASGMILAGLLRLVLADEQAGMLRVRHKTFDVAWYVGFGVLALIFALSLPQ
jgi:Protein of unknown function (DUF3017)